MVISKPLVTLVIENEKYKHKDSLHNFIYRIKANIQHFTMLQF